MLDFGARGLAGVAIVDFEASSLPCPGSFPIEVALGMPDSGAVRAWLIRPTPAWLARGLWAPEAERVHGLALDRLRAEGLEAAQAVAEMLAFLGDRVMLSDCVGADEAWLERLLGAAGWWGELEMHPLSRVFDELTGGGPAGADAVAVAVERAARTHPRTHRAGADVAHWVAVLQRLAGHPVSVAWPPAA